MCLFFSGKTLQDESRTLSGLGMKQDSKLILLGRKASAIQWTRSLSWGVVYSYFMQYIARSHNIMYIIIVHTYIHAYTCRHTCMCSSIAHTHTHTHTQNALSNFALCNTWACSKIARLLDSCKKQLSILLLYQ